MEYPCVILWPNGLGETRCSAEYSAKKAARDAVYRPGRGVLLDELSPADYQLYCSLDDELCQMQLDGHLGESTRY